MGMKKILMAVVAVAAVAMAGIAVAADSATVGVSATVAGNCKVLSPGSISYALDPATGGNATGTVTQPTFWCTKASTYTITDPGGIHDSAGSKRMKHATLSEYIPYTFTFTATGTGAGRGTTLSMDIASTVAEANYINASAGSYADSVILTIAP
jgi:spore coat protein U-like protein